MLKKIFLTPLLLVAIIGLSSPVVYAASVNPVLSAEQNVIQEKIKLLTKQLQLLQLQLVQSTSVASSSPMRSPLYPSSVVGTDFDYITEEDPNTFQCLEYVGYMPFEMPDKRSDTAPLVQDAYVFNMHFADSTTVGVGVDKDFGSREVAEADAMRYAPRLGKLPTLYRKNIHHIVVHQGGADTTAFAEDKGHFFVVYSDNATKRISTHDLEETFFHEGTHASIQDTYLKTATWQNAKAADGAYVTDYAESEDQEDFAESALFAYTMMYHPERFPEADRANIAAQIPNRIAFFKNIYTSPLTYSVGPVNPACLPKDTTAPTAPSGLVASTIESNKITLTWKAATDAVGVTSYLIERCQGKTCTSFSEVGTSKGTSYTNSGLAADTDYRFRVRATDAASNRSPYTTIVSYTTSQSATPSPEPTIVFFNNFETILSWKKSGDVTWYTGTPKVGSYSVQLRKTGSIEKAISLSGYKNVKVSFKMGAHSLDDNKENLQVHYYNGSAWVLLAEIANDSTGENKKLNPYTFNLPAAVNGQADFKLRFKLNGSGLEDYGYIDDVKVTAIK